MFYRSFVHKSGSPCGQILIGLNSLLDLQIAFMLHCCLIILCKIQQVL